MPVVSAADEPIERVDAGRVRIKKRDGVLLISSNAGSGLELQPRRVFNLVPGMQCVVFSVNLSGDAGASLEIASV